MFIVFAKGEINMNNIYKVIWSKAKNCYVVASEIARSHTKSASGSEKVREGARHALLALGAACAIACGGFVNVWAADTVEAQLAGGSTATVYTKEGTELYVADQIRYLTTDGDVLTNKNNIAALQTTTTDQEQKIATNTANIANNAAALNDKADKADVYSKTDADTTFATKTELNAKANAAALDTKADKTYVDTKLDGKADKATTLAGYGINDAYTKDATNTAITTKVNEEKNARELKDAELSGRIDTLSTTVDSKVSKTDLNTTLGNYYTQAETNAAIKNAVDDEKNARENAINGEVTNRNKAIADAIAVEETKRDAAITNAKTELKEKVTEEETKRKEEDAKLEGKITENTTAINNEKAVREAADTDLSKRIGTVTEDGKYIKKSATNNVSENLKVLDTQAKTNADNIQTNADNIKNNKDEIARVNGELVKTNDYFNAELGKTNDYFNKELGKTNNHFNTELGKTNAALQATNKRTAGIERTDTGVAADNQTVIEGKVHFDQNGNVSGVKDLQTDTIHATGEITSKGLDAGAGDIKTTGKVSAGDVSTGTLETTGDATIGGDLTVNGELKTDKIAMENKKTDADGTRYNSSTTITADGITHIGEVEKNGVITKSQFTHTEEGSETYATKGDKTDWTETRSDVKADGVKTEVKDSKGNRTNTSQTTEVINGFAIDQDGNSSTTSQTAKDINGNVTDKDGNKTDMKVTATENSIQIQDKDGKNTNLQVNKMGSSMTEIKNEDGKTTKTEQTATDITNTAEQGTIKNDAMNIENNASGNITNNAQHGTITNNAKDIVNNATGDMTNDVGGKLTTTVKGQATEDFKGGLKTDITGEEIHTVTGNQTNKVTGKQTNTVEGGQENIISGGQINNITGDQTTTISGTQTTTATDINRNASSSMVDKVDNAYGTNTETKVAGKTTTDVSIKGTGEEGKYIRGANESRDYLIKGTLKNSETKTVEKTSTEITDGNGKTSATIQDVNNLAGSVTNGTETGVSGIHANDNSVSIDSIVTDGNKYSVINQKKGSIQSTVVDGTNSTVILQDKDNVTIASSNGMVGIVGKDIVNNAQHTITNTAGTKITDKVGTNTRVIDSTSITDTVGTASRKIEDGKITDTAGDSTVTTENGKGTTFAKAGSAAYSTEAGATKDTNIAGNHITTGRVDANELGVSDKDEHGNTADLSVEAGKGVKASAGNGTTTGSLDVKADEVSSSVKDASGKGSTFKQRIDAIMMESKNVSIKAEEKLTNEAKVITNKASEVINNEAVNINNTATGIITSKASEIKNQADKLISNKVGENTWENMENGKITTSIKDGAKQNLTQSDAAGTTQSTVDGGKSTVTIQNADGLTDVVTNGTNTSIQNQTASAIQAAVKDQAGNENASLTDATTSANTIKNGTKANTVISTVDGTSFINSEAAAPVTGASGVGTAKNTTIKGNTITTGKVTMDYAEVMKDLGVRGNANITGKTTTGSLEVTGTSTLKGNVTMESNATVKKDLTVEGNTNLKNTKVDGTLDVTQKATFGDSVSIAKDLSVDGNATIKGDVTAKSYKVGDKTYISAAGINANDQKITNVADGSISEGSKDAVNGGQLYTVKNDLEGKVNKVGANAAAMANLHPMEFDPDSKWNVAAAIGNYGSETAAALGAFYRPNDDVMVNLSTAFGTGENMVGGGVSVRLGKGGNKLSREETNALKAQVADLTARMDALLSVLNPNMSKDFPDVPENHWAYEAVSRLAGNDIVQGYPDGEFHGERTMTRYEMAEIIYNALSRGAEAEKELVEEFKPELQAMAASEKATAEKAEG